MESSYLCTKFVRERTKQREPGCLHDWPSRAGRRQSQRAAPRQRASEQARCDHISFGHPVCTVLVTRISKGMQIFLLLNFSDELQPQTRFNEQIQIHIEVAHHSADFNHSVFGAVAGLSESMGRGLRFLYAHTDSAFPTGFER